MLSAEARSRADGRRRRSGRELRSAPCPRSASSPFLDLSQRPWERMDLPKEEQALLGDGELLQLVRSTTTKVRLPLCFNQLVCSRHRLDRVVHSDRVTKTCFYTPCSSWNHS